MTHPQGSVDGVPEAQAGRTGHPFLDERITVGLLVHLQARLLSRCLRGDLDAYPAFVCGLTDGRILVGRHIGWGFEMGGLP